jgi:hypothetical protein
MKKKILIDIEKFKEILLNSWHLLHEKQQELITIGVYPKVTTTSMIVKICLLHFDLTGLRHGQSTCTSCPQLWGQLS